MGIKLSDGEGLSQTCRGKKQLTVLREAAHKGGTHREPNLTSLSSPALLTGANFLGTRRL